MSLSIKQAWAGATASATSVAKAYVNVPTAGNLLVAVVHLSTSETLTDPIIDDIGDGVVWTKTLGPVVESNDSANLYMFSKVVGTPSGGGKTVTATGTASGAKAVDIVEYESSVAGTWAVTGTPVSTADGTAANPTPSSIVTDVADSVVVGVMLSNKSGSTAGTGFTLRRSYNFIRYLYIEDRIATSSGSYTAAWVQALTGAWSILAAAYGFTSSGGGVFIAQPPRMINQSVNRASTY